MATVFLHPKHKTYYYRAQIPKKFRRHFRGRVELWRSLKTEDKDEVKLKSLQWDTRAQRVFLTLKKHGATMSPAEIDSLIERWMDAELDLGEDHWVTHPVTGERLSDPLLVFHSLRHNGIHNLRKAGCPHHIEEILSGHAASSVHDRVYAHLELTPLSQLRVGLERLTYSEVVAALIQEAHS